MSAIERLRLRLRAILEVGVIAALAGWGVHTGHGMAAKFLLGVGAPLVGFGFWGAVDFRRARHAEGLRLVQELVVSGVAAVAWYASGGHLLGIALAAWSILYHAFVYASGARLLKPVTPRSHRAASSSPRRTSRGPGDVARPHRRPIAGAADGASARARPRFRGPSCRAAGRSGT